MAALDDKPAGSALAALKQAAVLIPNQTMLINTLPLLEAKDSSEIENIGVLAEHRVGRERLFIHPKLIGLITKDENGFEPY